MVSNTVTAYPHPFPASIPFDSTTFISPRSNPRAYEAALSSCHLGVVVDPASSCLDVNVSTSTSTSTSTPPLTHGEILTALQSLSPFYQTDLTQPFGLFTKVSKTYVRRCLLGDPGTTYKYLGLRMFSSDWTSAAGGVIARLNGLMEVRAAGHLRSYANSPTPPPLPPAAGPTSTSRSSTEWIRAET